MGLIYQNSRKNFENNKSKIFFNDLNKKLNGEECISLIEKASKIISKKKIKNISIISQNCLCWPIWYIAADRLCEKIFIINPALGHKALREIKLKNKIQLSVENPNYLVLDKLYRTEEINKISEKDKNYVRKDLLFTSGTTNIPKGVIIDEKAFIHVANILIEKFDITEDDNELLSMPFYHSFGLTRLRCVLLSGSQATITDGLKNFPNVYKLSKEKKLTGLSLVPSGITIIKSLLRKKITEFSKNIRYFEIGSSAISYEIRAWLNENFKSTKILHHYGMTEASRSFLRDISSSEKNKNRNIDNWVGEPIKGCKYKLENKENEDKNIGELLIKGINLFDEYTEKKLSRTKIINGWFRTGDICRIQNEKVFLIGRSDNQFNIGGFKVQAELIEKIIEEISEVKNSLCFSIKNDFLDETINCIIELKQNNQIDIFNKSIKERFKKYPSYYLPQKFIFQKIKLTPNGKKIRT